ncbi:MAG: NADH-quinone oxidoreductase subunit N, partial [Pseudomonadota bacterium]
AVAGAIASVVSAYYYLNIVRLMYLAEEGRPCEINAGPIQSGTLAVSATLMAAGWLPFLGGFGLTEVAGEAAASLLR